MTVPTVLLPPCTPFTSHMTDVFVVPVTMAINCCVAPVCRLEVVGDTDTVTVGVGGFTVTIALALFVVSAALRAVIVKLVLEVSEAGAV